MEPTQPRIPGDVLIERLELRNTKGEVLDVINFLVEIVIFEDMYSNALHGHIILSDAVNLLGTFPIIGNEYITMQIITPGFAGSDDDYIAKSFSVYSIQDRVLNEDREQLFKLMFCSMEAIEDNITRLSKKYDDTTDMIAEEIFNDHISMKRFVDPDDPIVSELVIGDRPHRSRSAFLPTFWTPFKCLNYLAKRAQGNENAAPSYLFFETTKSFYFASLESMIKEQLNAQMIFSEYQYTKKPVSEIKGEVLNPEEHPESVFKQGKMNIDYGYKIIEEIKFPKQNDLLFSQDSGHFASVLTTYDLLDKQAETFEHDHVFYFPDVVHMENYKANQGNVNYAPANDNMTFPFNVPRNIESRRFFSIIHKKNLTNDNQYSEMRPFDYIAQRNSIFGDMNNLKVEITVPGRTDVEVGNLIYLKYPSVGGKKAGDNETTLWDPYISGIYMITAVRHTITPLRHTMNIEIVKDSYNTPIQELVRF